MPLRGKLVLSERYNHSMTEPNPYRPTAIEELPSLPEQRSQQSDWRRALISFAITVVISIAISEFFALLSMQ